MTAPFASEQALRDAAVALARDAVGGDSGRVLDDPVFEAVTEHRARWPGYSACGDLPHYVLRALGFRDEHILNRDDDDGTAPWRIGANISRLVYATGAAFVWARPSRRPKPGDVLYVAYPEHVCVLDALDEQAGTIATCDYGLWDPRAAKPAARRRVSTFRSIAGSPRVGARTLRGWLDIARLPGMVAEDSTSNRPEAT